MIKIRNSRVIHLLSILLITFIGIGCSDQKPEEETSPSNVDESWVELFNGKDLSNWVQRGGEAKYTLENGQIVGTTVLDTPNSFLCTKENYSDFILELEVKVDTA